MRFFALAFITLSSASAVYAEETADLNGDVIGFETCFIQMMIDNPDNPMLEFMGPVICGERHIPMQQSCNFLDYMLFEKRDACKHDDLAIWQAQVNNREAAAIADGRLGLGAMHQSGLDRCNEESEGGIARLDCEIEINWRSTMEFMAADLVAELVGETQ